MKFNLNDFVTSLRYDKSTAENPLIPDGLIDTSRIVGPLFWMSRNGRAFDSAEDYSVPQFIGSFLAHVLPVNPTIDAYELAIESLSLLLFRVFKAIETICPDASPEEIIFLAADQDDLRQLASEQSMTPLIQDPDGTLRPNFASTPAFYVRVPNLDANRDGFIKRHIVRCFELYDKPEEPLDVIFCETDTEDDSHVPVVRKVNLNNLYDLTADRFNGYEDYFEYYFENPDQFL